MKRIPLIFLFCLLGQFSFGQKQIVSSNPTFQDLYPKRIGNLRMSTSTVSIGRIKNNVSKTDTIRLFNSSSKTMTLAVGPKVPAYVQAELGSPAIEAGKEGWMVVRYDASKVNDYGFVLDRIVLNTNDSVMAVKTINITATIEEYFNPADTMLPKARISSTVFDYGAVRQGEKTSRDLMIYNDGKSDLRIHKAKTSCGCLKTTFSKDVIAPSDSASIRVQFDSFGKEGKESRKVSVFINDPVMPEIKIEVKGEVFK
jgi:hypothetical protein